MDTKSLCLGALSIGAASGYEIKKMFEEGAFSHFYDAGYGSIYPALNKLLADGLVTCVEMEQEGRPAKKVYSLTDDGMAALKDSLRQAPAPDSLVMMFFAHLIDPGQRETVLESYIDYYRAGIEYIENAPCDDHPFGHKFVTGLGEALYRAAIDYLEENKADLLGAEKPEQESNKPKHGVLSSNSLVGGVS